MLTSSSDINEVLNEHEALCQYGPYTILTEISVIMLASSVGRINVLSEYAYFVHRC